MPRVKFGSFSFDAPEDWTLNAVILAGPPDEGDNQGAFQRTLFTTLERVAPDETAESYLGRQIEGLQRAHVDRTVVGDPEHVELAGGHPGVMTEQVVPGPTGAPVRQLQLIVVKNCVAHTAIASHLDGPLFEAVRPQFRALLLSFM